MGEPNRRRAGGTGPAAFPGRGDGAAMPSQSAIGAIIEKYESLAFASRPPMFFDAAPLRAVGAAATGPILEPPYVILKDGGTPTDGTFEADVTEVTALTLEVYGRGLAEVDAVVEGIRFDGGGMRGRAGFDHAVATGFPMTNYRLLSLILLDFRRSVSPSRGGDGRPVYVAEMRYSLSVERLS